MKVTKNAYELKRITPPAVLKGKSVVVIPAGWKIQDYDQNFDLEFVEIMTSEPFILDLSEVSK